MPADREEQRRIDRSGGGSGDRPETPLSFKDRQEWRRWLETNHAVAAGAWVIHYKKASPLPGLRYAEAVEEALCFGWIDSRMRSVDEHTTVQRYSPRRGTSVWSRLNVERVERLLAEGRMAPAGLSAVERAKESGAWGAAYSDRTPRAVPADLEAALREDPIAWANFNAFPTSARNLFVYWVEGARREATRRRRIEETVRRAVAGRRLSDS